MAKSSQDDKEIEALADKLQKELNAPTALRRPPDSITASEYARQSGCKHGTAGDFLRRQVEAGTMQRKKVGSVYYYYLPKR